MKIKAIIFKSKLKRFDYHRDQSKCPLIVKLIMLMYSKHQIWLKLTFHVINCRWMGKINHMFSFAYIEVRKLWHYPNDLLMWNGLRRCHWNGEIYQIAILVIDLDECGANCELWSMLTHEFAPNWSRFSSNNF